MVENCAIMKKQFVKKSKFPNSITAKQYYLSDKKNYFSFFFVLYCVGRKAILSLSLFYTHLIIMSRSVSIKSSIVRCSLCFCVYLYNQVFFFLASSCCCCFLFFANQVPFHLTCLRILSYLSLYIIRLSYKNE